MQKKTSQKLNVQKLKVKLISNELGWFVSIEQSKSFSYYWYSFLIWLMRTFMRYEIKIAKICRNIHNFLYCDHNDIR
jgi:hypothetical protein